MATVTGVLPIDPAIQSGSVYTRVFDGAMVSFDLNNPGMESVA